jgi:hypothetical protein
MPRSDPQQTELGEVRLPVARGRPVLDFIEAADPVGAAEDAQYRLVTYRRHCRRQEGTKLWNKLRRQNRAIFMATLELINLTNWDSSRVLATVGRLYRHLRLRRQTRFLFQDIWTVLDPETGEIVRGTEDPATTWDGDAWKMPNGGLVRICLSEAIAFPLVWDINRVLPGQYLRGVTWFNDAEEMFLYLAAHELRHLWQFEHERKAKQIYRLLGIDDETDADLNALRVLSEHRTCDRQGSQSSP